MITINNSGGFTMKKQASFFLFLVFMLMLSACTNTQPNNTTNKNEDASKQKLTVFTTVYPLLYFTERIGGEAVTVQSIYPAGADEHAFDPSQKDMIALAEADLFFYIGLGLESFVEKAKQSLKNEQVTMIATAESIAEEKLVEGHNHEDEEVDAHDDHAHENEDAHDEHAHENEDAHDDHAHENEDAHDDHAHENEDDHDEHNHGPSDPHVWISPTLSIELATAIKEALIAELPEQKEQFEKNFQQLQSELLELDEAFHEMANQAKRKTFFVSHAAFGYIANEYGLEQIAIAGLNSQSEPSQKQLAEIVKLAKENAVNYILFEQNVSSKLTDIVRKEIGAEALMLHNLGVLTAEDVKNNEDYFTLMYQNIETLEKALQS